MCVWVCVWCAGGCGCEHEILCVGQPMDRRPAQFLTGLLRTASGSSCVCARAIRVSARLHGLASQRYGRSTTCSPVVAAFRRGLTAPSPGSARSVSAGDAFHNRAGARARGPQSAHARAWRRHTLNAFRVAGIFQLFFSIYSENGGRSRPRTSMGAECVFL